MATVKGQNLGTPALPAIKQADLADKNLLQLNSVLNQIWTKILYLAGGAGAINIPNDFTAQSVSIPSQTQTPSDPTQVITLQTALALFDPSNTRTALTAGAFQTNPTTVAAAQPLPNNGSATRAVSGFASTSPGAPGQLAFDSTYLYVCVSTNSWRRIALSAF